MRTGNLQIAASWGLDGLGATEGPPVTCDWTAEGAMPPLLPWLAILALLALKPNRGWSAWWIWLPLAGLAAGWHYLQRAIEGSNTGLPNGALDVLFDVPVALVFGLAALWLLASYLGRSHRLSAFLGAWFLLLVFIVFSFAALAGWDQGVEPIMGLLDPRQFAATTGGGVMAVPLLVPLALLALVVAAAMLLGGLACRGRDGRFRLCAWLFLSLVAVWVALAAALHFLCPTALLLNMEFGPLLFLGLFMALFTFAMLLPFLILSSASPFFRQRLKALLRVTPETPPLMAPLPAAA